MSAHPVALPSPAGAPVTRRQWTVAAALAAAVTVAAGSLAVTLTVHPARPDTPAGQATVETWTGPWLGDRPAWASDPDHPYRDWPGITQENGR